MNIRSWLCASSLNRKLVDKAIEARADIALFDLEDSVPAHQKQEARDALALHFEAAPKISTAVRVNSLMTADGLKDILLLLERGIAPDFVLLPKVCVPADILLATSVLKDSQPNIQLFAVVETVESLHGLRTLAARPPGLSGLIFGAADFAADIGVDLDLANLSYVRHELALLARRFDVPAIDSPCFHLRDEVPLRREIAEVRQLGFGGKIAIHPAQVPVINESFTPTAEAIERARRLLAAREAQSGRSILEVDDQMVGPPFMRRARHLLATAQAVGEPDRRGRRDGRRA